MRKVLMFDLGGVLVLNELFDELKKMLAEELDENALKDKWLRSATVRAFELGACSPETFSNSMVEEFQLNSTPSEFLSAFTHWPKGFYDGAEGLLKQLSERHTVACLSNSNELHWKTSVTSHFQHAYSSHQMKRIKPDVEVFRFVTNDLGVEPSDVAFFDDSRLNIEAAEAFGWDAHLTVGYQELLIVLSEMGVTQ